MIASNGKPNGKKAKLDKRKPKRKKSKRDKVEHSKKEAFLRAFVEGWTVSAAAASLGMSRTTHYNWLNDDPEYAERFKQAQVEQQDRLEEEIARRAVKGLRSYKFHHGRPVMIQCDPRDPEGRCVGKDDDGSEIWLKHYYEHLYSDNLLMFKAKAEMPDKYGDKLKHEGGEKPIQLQFVAVDSREKVIEFDKFKERLSG